MSQNPIFLAFVHFFSFVKKNEPKKDSRNNTHSQGSTRHKATRPLCGFLRQMSPRHLIFDFTSVTLYFAFPALLLIQDVLNI
jgi:hypothetical protein